jgi:hypothetical protein
MTVAVEACGIQPVKRIDKECYDGANQGPVERAGPGPRGVRLIDDTARREAATLRQQVERRLVDRAFRDAAFRSLLIDDPKAAIRAEFGIMVPAGLTVTVLEETSNSLYLVLPNQDREEMLTDADLDELTRGTFESTGLGGAM